MRKTTLVFILFAAVLGLRLVTNQRSQVRDRVHPTRRRTQEVLDFQFESHRGAPAPRNIFLDVGTNQGSVVEAFYEGKPSSDSNNPNWKFGVEGYDPKDWFVYGFEASPSHDAKLDSLEMKYGSQLKIFHPLAVWNASNETIKLSIDDGWGKEHAEWGSSAFTNIKDGSGAFFMASSVDLAEFMITHVHPQDTVYMKMNVEGAEFPIIRKLLQEGLLCLIDHLDIYWHLQFFHGRERTEAEKLMKLSKFAFNSVCNTQLHTWSVHVA